MKFYNNKTICREKYARGLLLSATAVAQGISDDVEEEEGTIEIDLEGGTTPAGSLDSNIERCNDMFIIPHKQKKRRRRRRRKVREASSIVQILLYWTLWAFRTFGGDTEEEEEKNPMDDGAIKDATSLFFSLFHRASLEGETPNPRA